MKVGIVGFQGYRNLNFKGKNDVIAFMDFDGTYQDSKHPETQQTLEKGLAELRAEYAKKGINFMPSIVTARPKVRLMKEHPSSEIQWSITQNGGEIINGLPTPEKADYESWKKLNESTGFNAKRVQDIVFDLAKNPEFLNLKILKVADVVNNPAASECEYMQPFCIALDDIKLGNKETKACLTDSEYKVPNQIKKFVSRLSQELNNQGIQFELNSPYLFKGKPYIMFDVATPYANKGRAIDFLLKELDILPENVIVAGDGGNDIAMMRPLDSKSKGDGRSLIILGENKELIKQVKKLSNDTVIIRPASEPSSIGVLEGLKMHLERIAKRISMK